jgi:hypothetical protein
MPITNTLMYTKNIMSRVTLINLIHYHCSRRVILLLKHVILFEKCKITPLLSKMTLFIFTRLGDFTQNCETYIPYRKNSRPAHNFTPKK